MFRLTLLLCSPAFLLLRRRQRNRKREPIPGTSTFWWRRRSFNCCSKRRSSGSEEKMFREIRKRSRGQPKLVLIESGQPMVRRHPRRLRWFSTLLGQALDWWKDRRQQRRLRVMFGPTNDDEVA